MKKYFSVLATALFSLAISNAFADTTCPDTKTIRMMGSHFNMAYAFGPGAWELISEPYTIDGVTWQTLYATELPSVSDPVDAVTTGQIRFNTSPLLTEPKMMDNGTEVGCEYTPRGSSYEVVAVNSVIYGLRKLKI